MQHPWTVLTSILLMNCALQAGEPPEAEALRRLVDTRSKLHAALNARMASDARIEAPFDLHLRLDEAIEFHSTIVFSNPEGLELVSLEVGLHRRGGRWLAPSWRIDGQLRSWLKEVSVDESGLQATADQVTGRLRFKSRLGMTGPIDIAPGNTMHGHNKSGTIPVMEWGVGRQRTQLNVQEFTVSLQRPSAKAMAFVLTFNDGLRGVAFNERLQQDAPWANDLTLVREWLGPNRTYNYGRSDYNLGVHDHQPQDLRLEGDRFFGPLPVSITDDQWRSGGTQLYKIEGRVRDGRLNGTYQVTGGFGNHDGTVQGRVGSALSGSFSTTDQGKSWERVAVGTFCPVSSTLPPLDEVDIPGIVKDPVQVTRWACRLYREIAGLNRALRDYPESFEQTASQQPDPIFPDASPGALALALTGLADTAANAAAATLAGTSLIVGEAHPADGDFGPHIKTSPLAASPAGGSQVPEGKPEASAQIWQSPIGWQVLGPFVTDEVRPMAGIELPEATVLPSPTNLSWRLDRRTGDRRHLKGRTVTWIPQAPPFDTLQVPKEAWEPLWVKKNRLSTYGNWMDETTEDERVRIIEEKSRANLFYGVTTLHSPKDQTLWMAVRTRTAARLWLDGQPLWCSGDEHNPSAWSLFPVTLKAGANRLMTTTAEPCTYFPGGSKGWSWDTASTSRLWVRVLLCTQGRPRSDEERTRQDAAEVAARKKIVSAEVRGPLGDGTSIYSDADPPLAWDLAKGINVAWRQPLRSSDSDVVIWKDRVYVNTEPDTLVCLDQGTGTIRWQVTSDIFATLTAKDASIRTVLAEYADVCDRIRQSGERIARYDQEIYDLHEEEGSTPSSTCLKLEAERKEITVQKKELETKSNALRQRLISVLGDKGLPTGLTASSSPLIDAGTIWIHYGTGLLTAVDHEGKRKWQVPTNSTWGGSKLLSPILAGRTAQGQRRLVVALPAVKEGPPPAIGQPPTREYGRQFLAVDADTGIELWRSSFLPREAIAPVHLPLTRTDGAIRDLLVGADGLVLDAQDGSVILAGYQDLELGAFSPAWACTPRLVGNVVHLGSEAVLRIWLNGNEVCRRILWCTNRWGTNTSCEIIQDGLIYQLRQTEESSAHTPVPWDMVKVMDAQFGTTVAKHKPALRDAFNPAGMALAGPWLMLFDRGGAALGLKDETPKMAIVAAGDLPKALYDQGWLRTSSIPVFVGNRIFVQGEGAAWCLGITDDAGRTYQEEVLAGRIIHVELRKPDPAPVSEIAPAKQVTLSPETPVDRLTRSFTPRNWLFSGPLPKTGTDAPLAPLGDQTVQVGQKISLGGVDSTFKPLGPELLVPSGGSKELFQGARGFIPLFAINFFRAVDFREDTCAYYISLLEVARTTTYRLDLKSKGARAWLAETPVEHEQIMRLKPGIYPFVVRLDTPRIPPLNRDKFRLMPRFYQVIDPQEVADRWIAKVRFRKDWLERFQKTLPDTPLARRAALFLRYLDPKTTPKSDYQN